ncbi:hypothetical protein COEREDRAFT_89266 [Coemansia reversa NRRL 1564]|uniref:Uncharacterized protein n=1 Tax=Coemansia reversa (strain ATCC 12441 / NRRL 1564) TaxID=763665 RepID=A0A2G5B3X1_COERN|nr:hypothetical protein COEREDRAFT_89266 [Coemansia reversa NRRL 1564]|eukprot:PIA13743.1 hypothetical protein COEREDRAFT_89266 [Coemansia reversa NRRL 1564]
MLLHLEVKDGKLDYLRTNNNLSFLYIWDRNCMRTISLSSRLQWAFRGTVLPGALATGDVDNDGCNEFVVGSVQGELAVFRGRGGCGSWRYSEEQIEPEFDCWDEVERGEIPADAELQYNERRGSRQQSTFNSMGYSATSARESLSVDDILYMFEGNKAFVPPAVPGDTSEDELGGARRASFNTSDPELTSHIKWEDALDLERDGRKPWILAQKLGTISSVVIADISNSGHNSIVVVNGEGKCHIFDYPFKRRHHPDTAKRKRQRMHQRRFSQERFFKDGITTSSHKYNSNQDNTQQSQGSQQQQQSYTGSVGVQVSRVPTTTSSNGDAVEIVGSPPGGLGRMGSQSFLHVPRTKSMFSDVMGGVSRQDASDYRAPNASASTPAMHGYTATDEQPGVGHSPSAAVLALQHAAATAATEGSGGSRSASAASIREMSASKHLWQPTSSLEKQPYEQNGRIGQIPEYDMASVSNVSSQADPPLTILNSRAARDATPNTPAAANSSAQGRFPDASRAPTSSIAANTRTASTQDGFSAEFGSGRRRRPGATEIGMDTLSAIFAEADVESDLYSSDDLSEDDDATLLTAEEITDIENIWGANVGKRSGDWFPYVLERPDTTFDIPTNVEHALIADIDNNGLNELVLTSTDGFVYIFRVEPSIKQMVKPTITSLGTFSSIPTTLPSVNMTGNGSPYLHMSAPRSPDASDIDLDYIGKSSDLLASRERRGKDACGNYFAQANHLGEQQASIPSSPSAAPPTQSTRASVAPGAVSEAQSGPNSDLSLVNQLLRTIKDSSVMQGEASTSSNSSARGEHHESYRPMGELSAGSYTYSPQNISTSSNAVDTNMSSAVTSQASAQSMLHAASRHQSPRKRASLTSRMRESFSYIVSGSETPRKPGTMFNRTAPPSLNHSRVHTTNNSANSTSAHSRRQSADQLTDIASKGTAGHEKCDIPLKAPSVVQPTPVIVTSESTHMQHRRRGRHNTICIGGLDATGATFENLSNAPKVVSGDLPRIIENSPSASQIRKPTSSFLSQDKPVQSPDDRGKAVARKPALSSKAADREPIASDHQIQTSAGHGHSRSGSIFKFAGPSRAHSRRSSISSIASKLRASLDNIHDQSLDASADNTGKISRRESLGSNMSACENSTYNNNKGTSYAAAPLQTTVRAKGSFSKPTMQHKPLLERQDQQVHDGQAQEEGQKDLLNVTVESGMPADDNASLISQVTERLEGITSSSKRKPATKSDKLAATTSAAATHAKHTNALCDLLEREAELQLPPPRSVVDWSSAAADKVATWFLDNIPGGISMVNASADVFGEPLSSRRRIVYTDEASEYSYSSCSCSICSRDSDDLYSSDSSSDFAANNQPMHFAEARQNQMRPATHTATPGITVNNVKGESSLNHNVVANSMTVYSASATAAAHSDMHLPQPLELSSIHGGRHQQHNFSRDSTKEAGEKGLEHTDFSNHEPHHAQSSDGAEQAEADLADGHLFSVTKPQQFLLLSKPGGRFVPIDMKKGVILPTVELPSVPSTILTGGNTSHLMNIDASGSLASFYMPASAGVSMPLSSAIDFTGVSGSLAYRSPSWQSGSVPWGHNPPTMSFNSTGVIAKSPAGMTDSDISKVPANQQSLPEPSSSSAPRAAIVNNLAVSSAQTESAATQPELDASRLGVGTSYASMFNPGKTSGAMLISTNLRAQRSLHRVSHDILRDQGSATRLGTGQMYRGQELGGAAAPIVGGYLPGMYDRRGLGFAGLRGYIGSNSSSKSNTGSRYRITAGSSGNIHGDDAGLLSGCYTPVPSAQPSTARGFSFGSQGISTGKMPREPTPGYFSSVSTNTSALNATDRSLKLAYETSKQGTHQQRNASGMPAQTPASPQRSQQLRRYSPLLMGLQSYKDGSPLSTIKDQEDALDIEDQRGNRRNLSPTNQMPNMEAGNMAPNLQSMRATPPEMHTMPYSEMVASHNVERGLWASTDPASARSHSSFGTGTSINYVSAQGKEEEIEEAPLPMELGVTTYLVGSVSSGKRYRRIVPGAPLNTEDVDYQPDLEETAAETDDGDSLRELVSLVTMDGMVSCYDLERKVNHFVSLNSKDPVLGIWKAKMHEEVCNPSPLETMLQQDKITIDSVSSSRLLNSTPVKRIYRRVGLSRRDLVDAVKYSSYVESCVQFINKLDNQRRRHNKHKSRDIYRTRRMSYGTSSGKQQPISSYKLGKAPLRTTRGNTLARLERVGLNTRLRENLQRDYRGGQTMRSFGGRMHNLAVSTGASTGTHPSTADPAVSVAFTSSNHATEDENSHATTSKASTPNLSFSPAAHRTSIGKTALSTAAAITDCRSDDDSSCESSSDSSVDKDERDGGTGAHTQGVPAANNSSSNNNLAPPRSFSQMDPLQLQRTINIDIAAALSGWYGRNKDDFRQGLNVSDHLIVSTWRGTTYFVDVSTILDIAHYDELYMYRWNNNAAAAAESALATAAPASEREGWSSIDAQSCGLSTNYGHLSNFTDINGLISRLLTNASVIQFKFQDTVSAFLASTYAPATGGPNVPCIFYVDYKDRIWVYYHLDEVAEMDDVYGATWLRDEPERLHTPESRAREAEKGVDYISYGKPFSTVDLAYRRINTDPWIPMPDDELYHGIVSLETPSYPYSAKNWCKPGRTSTCANKMGDVVASTTAGAASEAYCSNDKEPSLGSPNEAQHGSKTGTHVYESSRTPSESSTQAFALQANANVTGSFHTSYLLGPYLCPIWSDINSVDLYDVGSCNLLELAMPELLAMKHVFCEELDISPESVDERTNLATIPGLANWVRNCLYFL